MKLAKVTLALTLACAVALPPAAAGWLRQGIDEMPVQLETLRGDAALLDGVELNAVLQQGLEYFDKGRFGVWRQEIGFENGEPVVESEFVPEFGVKENGWYDMYGTDAMALRLSWWQEPEWLQKYEEMGLSGDHPVEDEIEKSEFWLGSGLNRPDEMETAWEESLSESRLDYDLEIPLTAKGPKGAVLQLRVGENGRRDMRYPTAPEMRSTNEIFEVDGRFFAAVSDWGMIGTGWDVTTDSRGSGGTYYGGGTAYQIGEGLNGEEMPEYGLVEYTLQGGLMELELQPAEYGSGPKELKVKPLWPMECTAEGAHLLGMQRTEGGKLAMLTIENGQYCVRAYDPRTGAKQTAALGEWSGDPFTAVQLECGGEVLLARLCLYGGGGGGNQYTNYIAADLSGSAPALKVLAAGETSAQFAGLTNDGRWERAKLAWRNGMLYSALNEGKRCSLRVLQGEETLYSGVLYAADRQLQTEALEWPDNAYRYESGSYSLRDGLVWNAQDLELRAGE